MDVLFSTTNGTECAEALAEAESVEVAEADGEEVVAEEVDGDWVGAGAVIVVVDVVRSATG